MATQVPTLDVEKRKLLGSRHSTRLRGTGRVPAVIYGHKQDPVHVSMVEKTFTELLHDQAHVVEVHMDSQTEPCLIKDVQWDHLGSHILHADLARVDLTESVTVSVDLELTGEAVGLKEVGAILENPVTELEVQCQAGNIPSSIKIDVTNLTLGDTITVADIQLPEGVAAAGDAETAIATIRLLAEEVEEEPVEAAEGEPEVIGKQPEEEGAAEATEE